MTVPCNPSYIRVGGQWCLLIIEELLSWSDAENRCAEHGGGLITIDSALKNKVVVSFIGIGASGECRKNDVDDTIIFSVFSIAIWSYRPSLMVGNM